ncbi:MAG: Ldh family oxidoreductase [SAR324 cluster bacterium]|nr:Ldh family oxidoreductase [SAR324 cluster bacterium]
MPTFTADSLRAMSREFFRAAGFPPEEAATIGRLLVEANLTGHDTHGVRHLGPYLERIRKGEIVPGAPVTVLHETPTTALLSGHRTLGHVAATRAAEIGIEKARQMKISAVGVRNLEHVGRVGAYPEMAARQGLVCIAFVNAQGRGIQVTPFGGNERRIGTNPISMAFPNPEGDPFLLDMATCTTAANKIRQAADRGQKLAPGLILDGNGAPSEDPQDFLNGDGMLLPVGGNRGHKGFGLAMMVDLMSGVLAGSGTAAAGSAGPLDNGTFLITLDPSAFVPPEEYAEQSRALADYVEATRTPPGGERVMMPGTFEERHRRERSEGGIPIDEAVWNSMKKALAELEVAEPVPMA